MEKRFNDTGLCIPAKHYMIDTSTKIKKTFKFIERGEYFIINRPRQYGKTTTLDFIKRNLNKEEYLVIFISFEGVGDDMFKKEDLFCKSFLEILSDKMEYTNEVVADIIKKYNKNVDSFKSLSKAISKIIVEIDKKVVLLIDEVDSSSNYPLFIRFLAMLRDKYLFREDEPTFYSIVLAGLHDVKTLKLKLRPDDKATYNSPWNIAADFDVDMNFDAEEIESMLLQYTDETDVKMDTKKIAQTIHFFTSGYPYFVSKLCKIIDEKIYLDKKNISWGKEDVIEAVKILLSIKSNTNFDSLIKNLENNKELYKVVESIIVGNVKLSYSTSTPIVHFGEMHGFFSASSDNKLKIHNKIYEEYLTNHITVSREIKHSIFNSVQSMYLKANGKLDIKKILVKFQDVIEEKYSKTDLMKSDEFLENDLRMLFLVFLKPIINGTGFSYKEVQTSAERRLDVIVLFKDEKFIIELKLWYGEKYHKEGILQIKDYMRREHLNNGYMIIMSKNKTKKFTSSDEDGLFTIWM